MMRVIAGAEMQKLEKKAFETLGLSPLLVMENAGSRIVEVLKTSFAPLESKRVHILVGSGNNGGDGLVVARHLLANGARVKVYVVGNRAKPSRENQINFEILERLGVDIVNVDARQLGKVKFSLSLADVIVDAIFGTGFVDQVDPELEALINIVNEIQCPKVAIDCPTGVNATTGAVITTAVKAEITINLGLLKLGCVLYPGQLYAGKNVVVDLGFPLSTEAITCQLLQCDALDYLPKRQPWAHKGTFGQSLVVAGSQPYAGAAYLCGQAILRGGGGLATVAVPQGIYERFSPDELIVVPVPQAEEGFFGQASLTRLARLIKGKDVLAIGPGIGRDGETIKVVQEILKDWEQPAVIDADALMALTPEFLNKVPQSRRAKWIITPHPGEMGRLIGIDAAAVNAERLEVACEFAKKWGLVVVLKGAPTIIASPERTYINSTGNHGLATAGSGDVLTGLISALLSQGLEPIQAGAVGVYIHGRAGDLAGMQGQTGVKAGDLLNFIQQVLP